MYSENKYIDFYEWLIDKAAKKYICLYSKETIKKEFSEYKKNYGATKKIVYFFDSLDDLSKHYLVKRMTGYRTKKDNQASNKEELTIKQIAAELYEFRSNFLHNAELINAISSASTIYKKSATQLMISNISLDDLCLIFVRGVLLRFGFAANQLPKLID